MLNADSRTLNSESDVHSSAAPPTSPSAAALSCTAWTRCTICSIGVPGSARLISLTRKLDSSARPRRPSSDSDRNVSGTNESSAKYAIIAAKWGPRSAKNLRPRSRRLTRTGRNMLYLPDGRRASTRRSHGDLVADPGRGRLRRAGRGRRGDARGGPGERARRGRRPSAPARSGPEGRLGRAPDPARGRDGRGERLRRRRWPDADRGDDRTRPHGRARVLRPEERAALDRSEAGGAQADAEEAGRSEEDHRCEEEDRPAQEEDRCDVASRRSSASRAECSPGQDRAAGV